MTHSGVCVDDAPSSRIVSVRVIVGQEGLEVNATASGRGHESATAHEIGECLFLACREGDVRDFATGVDGHGGANRPSLWVDGLSHYVCCQPVVTRVCHHVARLRDWTDSWT